MAGSDDQLQGVRERILQEAHWRFSSAAYSEVSAAGIARSAGTSQPNLYTYFPNKQALYAEVVDRELTRTLGGVAGRLRKASAPRLLSSCLDEFVTQVVTSPLLLRAFRGGDAGGFQALSTMGALDRLIGLVESELLHRVALGQVTTSLPVRQTATGAVTIIVALTVLVCQLDMEPRSDRRAALEATLDRLIAAPSSPELDDDPHYSTHWPHPQDKSHTQ